MIMNPKIEYILSIIFFSFLAGSLLAQPATYVDETGIMRWTESEEEVTAFGVNYSMPFSSLREHEQLGVALQEAIEADIYHLARMGLDGYRIHVWDTDISDFDGNLLFNKQLQLFDYLLYQLKERDIKIFLTAMNHFGGANRGFRYKYGGKQGCLTNPDSFPAQENYLAQFVSHVNPYTGIAYKDDPDIIGFEINNEPVYHSQRPDLTREYIDRMAAAIRNAGAENPIFYNVSHNIGQIDSFCADEIEGGTFQWYPICLNGNQDLKGNYLPAVDKFINPFADHPRFQNMAKLAYEIDAADVGRSSFIYPAMARSLREAGFQVAAQFAYIPMNVAYSNFRWTTHFLNLAYAPNKAIGVMIAKEAFHHVPMGESYGRYPHNNTFGVFRLDYEEDLAEMVADEKFFYTNDTRTSPPNPQLLTQVAGVGSSPIVEYPGTGAYFLDKLEDGIWRLEVMPDAIWVNDPHFATALDREVSVIQWREWIMGLNLPDLGEDFSISGLNSGNDHEAVANGRRFEITPGAYLLTRNGETSDWRGTDFIRNLRLDEFHAPEAHAKETYVVHEPPRETTVGEELSLTAGIVSPDGLPDRVDLVIVKQRQHQAIRMRETSAYHYTANVPSRFLQEPGLLRYYITVGIGGEYETFPIKFRGDHPLDRRQRTGQTDFLPGDPYVTKIMNPNDPISIFEADKDWEKLTRKDASINPNISSDTGKVVASFTLPRGTSELAYQHYCGDRIEMRPGDLESRERLVVLGYALDDNPCVLRLNLVMKDATVYGGNMVVEPEEGRYALSLNELELEPWRMINPSIPHFQRRLVETLEPSEFRLEEVEQVQIIVNPERPGGRSGAAAGVAIERILLQ